MNIHPPTWVIENVSEHKTLCALYAKSIVISVHLNMLACRVRGICIKYSPILPCGAKIILL